MGEPPIYDEFPLPAVLTPNPLGGDLTWKIKCFADPSHKRGRLHEVVLHEDWSITVPHDLEAERVAVALGSYLSCLRLVDEVVPAAETYMRRQLRVDVPDVVRGVGGLWYQGTRVSSCCASTASWPTLNAAAAHWRGAHHVAAERGTRTDLLKTFGKEMLRARGLEDPVPPPRDTHLAGKVVANKRELHELWDSGISPELATALHRSVGATTPLPVAFFTGAATRRPRLGWVRSTADAVPERADLTWLTWTETPADRDDPTLRASWLRLGVPRADIITLGGSPYGPEEVRRLAELLGRSGHTAAALLARCVRADCFPGVTELGEVCVLADAPTDVLGRAALNRLEAAIDLPAARDHLALALLTCGSPVVAAEVIRMTGTLDPVALRQGLNDWEQRRQERTTTHRA